jgi:hypothetical protein
MTTRHRAKSATFDGTSISSLVDVSEQMTHNGENLYASDGSVAIDGIDYDGVHAVVTVTTYDASVADGFAVGETGSLAIVYAERADGSGDETGDVTHTFASAYFRGHSTSAPNAQGAGTSQLEFVCISADGTAGAVRTVS